MLLPTGRAPFFFQYSGACRRRTPRTRVDSKVPKKTRLIETFPNATLPDFDPAPRQSPSVCAENFVENRCTRVARSRAWRAPGCCRRRGALCCRRSRSSRPPRSRSENRTLQTASMPMPHAHSPEAASPEANKPGGQQARRPTSPERPRVDASRGTVGREADLPRRTNPQPGGRLPSAPEAPLRRCNLGGPPCSHTLCGAFGPWSNQNASMPRHLASRSRPAPFFFQYLGACQRRTPRTRVDSKVPKKARLIETFPNATLYSYGLCSYGLDATPPSLAFLPRAFCARTHALHPEAAT